MEVGNREEHLYLAKIADEAEVFCDVISEMKKVVAFSADLTRQQRHLLTSAYRNSIEKQKRPLKIISYLERKAEKKGSEFIYLVRNFKKQIKEDIVQLCQDILTIIESQLLPNVSNAEAEISYLGMKGYYNKLLFEYSQIGAKEGLIKEIEEAYVLGQSLAEVKLSTTNPVRLQLISQFSVFLYDLKNDVEKACSIVKQAFDKAIKDIDQVSEEQYKDATTNLALMRDNLTLWTSQLEQEAQYQQK